MSDEDDRMVIYRADLPTPGQSLDVEWVRTADWDRHWALVFTGVTCFQELRRIASYTEAKSTATAIAGRFFARMEATA